MLAKTRGFTLLELLISITILGIMMVVILGSFRLGTRAWEKGEARADYNQKLRVILDHILEEIRSAHSLFITVDEYGEEETKYHAFWGEPDRIKFITTAASLDSEPSLVYTRAVTYFVEPGSGLMMKEIPCLGGDCFGDLEDQEAVLLDSNVSDLTFRYAYIPEPEKGEEEEAVPEREWVTLWDPTDKEGILFRKAAEGEEEGETGPPVQKLPCAVEITLALEFVEENKSKELPPLVVPIYLGQEVYLPKEAL